MPRNGSGTYSLPSGNPVITGTTISSTVQNNTMSDVASALTASISADGQTPVTADIPFNNHKAKGLAAGTSAGDAIAYGQTGAALTSPVLTTPVIASITNTGALTLPAGPDTLVGRATTDTLTNKTLTAPVISTISNTGTLTLPTATDTLVGRATTDTLTNKTVGSTGLVMSNVAQAGSTVLDWYEENTWTPAPSATGGTPTYSSTGNFTRIGNRVFFDGFVQITALNGATGNVQIQGLPYTISSTYQSVAQVGFSGSNAGTATAFATLGLGGTLAALKNSNGGSFTATQITNLPWSVLITGSYQL